MGVLDEGLRDCGGHLNRLVGDARAADIDRVGADVACGARGVAVGDSVAGALHELEGVGFGRVVDPMPGCAGGAELIGEDPEIRGAAVEIHVYGLAADLDG